MVSRIRRAWFDRLRVNAVEYALIVTLVSVAIIGGATLFGADIGSLFERSRAKVESAAANLN